MSKVNSGGYAISAAAFVGAIVGGLLLSGIVLYDLARLKPPSPASAKLNQEPQQVSDSPNSDTAADSDAPQPNRAAVNQDDAKPNNRAHSDQARPKDDKPSTDGWRDVIAIASNAIIAVFTIVLALVAWLQRRTMRDQAEYMRMEHRAWVSFDEPALSPIVAGEQLKLTLPAKNYGSTPGFVTRQIGDVIFGTPGSSIADERLARFRDLLDSEPINEWIVSPGDRLVFRTIKNNDRLFSGVLAEINKGAIDLFVVAAIEYLDFEGSPHRTQCCYRYNSEDGVLWAHNKHNYMT